MNKISVDWALEVLGLKEEIFEEYSLMDFEDAISDKLGIRYEFDHDKDPEDLYLFRAE